MNLYVVSVILHQSLHVTCGVWGLCASVKCAMFECHKSYAPHISQ
jgi:hypothetical protein